MRTLLKRLQAQFARYDEDAFAALANRGLFRRARKDMEKTEARIEEKEERVLVHLDRYVVELDDRGPAMASCSCPASGVCQHILCACLVLAAAAGEEAASASEASAEPPKPEQTRDELHRRLLEVTMEELERWAGRPGIRWALDFAADADVESLTFGGDRHIVMTFARPRMSFRYMGGGLDAVVTDYKGSDRNRRIAGAILTYQRAYGMPLPSLPPRRTGTGTGSAAGGAPEAGEAQAPEGSSAAQVAALRNAVLQASAALVCESVEIGLSHLSDTIVQRLTTLSVSARGAQLHRLALMLRGLADQAEMLVERAGLADEERLFDDLALTCVLVRAIQGVSGGGSGAGAAAIPIHLLGEARSVYDEIGKLELAGLGAYPWRTASGYLGLTLVFWRPKEERWYSFTEARPEIQGGLDPIARYSAPGPWTGVGAPAELMGRAVTLLDARVNRLGRLSSSEKTAAILHSAWPLEHILERSVRDWSLLGRHPRALSLLAERNFHDDLAVLSPTGFGRPAFDPALQRLIWPLLDERGERLVAALDHGPYTRHAIERLEALDEEKMKKIRGILVRLRRHPGGILAEPISLLGQSPGLPVDVLSFNPATDNAPKEGLFAWFKKAGGGRERDPAPARAPQGVKPSWQRLLDALTRECLRAAERGLKSGDRGKKTLPASVLASIDRCERAGLGIFNAAATSVAGGELSSAELLLRLRYLNLQHYRIAGISE